MKNRVVSISLAVVFILSVSLIGCAGEETAEYNLTISSTEGGSVTSPGEGTFTYDQGEKVNLAAVPDEGYQFANWTGDVNTIADVNAASTTITMDGDYEIAANFEKTPTITFAIAGPMTEFQGEHQWWGAELARDEINAAGGVTINGTKYTIQLVRVETKELTEGENGSTGTANLNAVIDTVHFVIGGLQTEVVSVYREVAMSAGKIFMDCGAATGALQFSVVNDYDHYKYWFKTVPYNETFIVNAAFKITRTIGTILKQRLEDAGDAVAEDYRVPEDGKLRVAILVEDATWANGIANAAQTWLPTLGFAVVGTWRPSATATEITAELSQIAAAKPHVVFTAFAGPVATVYSSQRVELGIPGMTTGINVPGQQKEHWANTKGTCNGEITLSTWAEGLHNTAKTAAFFNAFVAKTGTYPYYPAGTYDAIYQVKEAIEAVAATHGWDDIAEVVDLANIDALIQYLEASHYTGTDGTTAYYPMPAITLNATSPGRPGLYALSDAQIGELYDLASYGKTYDQNQWLCGYVSGVQRPHVAHDLVYGPGYQTGIGTQWQDGHKVGVWPIELGDEYDAALTDQYGCWNFEYPGTADVVIPIEGFLAS